MTLVFKWLKGVFTDFFRIFLTVHLRIIPVGKQLESQFFSIIYLFESSTCFEQPCAHPQEDNCMNITSSIITLC